MTDFGNYVVSNIMGFEIGLFLGVIPATIAGIWWLKRLIFD